jgi:hypothetical protein
MPILGIIASAITGNLVTTSYESIATVTVGGGGAADITFSSIPSDYTHLQIRGIGRCDDAGDRTALSVMINSDNGSNYITHILTGTGAATSAQGITGQTGSGNQIGGSSTITGAAAGASIFGVSVIDILDYKNTNKYKVIRTLAGQDQNSSSGRITLTSGLYLSTTAITSISLSPSGGSNFVQYSQFALYGIKS